VTDSSAMTWLSVSTEGPTATGFSARPPRWEIIRPGQRPEPTIHTFIPEGPFVSPITKGYLSTLTNSVRRPRRAGTSAPAVRHPPTAEPNPRPRESERSSARHPSAAMPTSSLAAFCDPVGATVTLFVHLGSTCTGVTDALHGAHIPTRNPDASLVAPIPPPSDGTLLHVRRHRWIRAAAATGGTWRANARQNDAPPEAHRSELIIPSGRRVFAERPTQEFEGTL